MTESLEDIVAPVLARWLKPLTADDAANAVADALRAAAVVPPEPATHDTLSGIVADLAHVNPRHHTAVETLRQRARAAVAAVDGEAPAT